MHKLLARQLKAHFGDQPVPASLRPLLDHIDASYRQNDADRAMLDHSMSTVSQELLERNQRLADALQRSSGHEQALDHTLGLLRATIESTADGILVTDSEGRIVLTNRQFEEIWRMADYQGDRRDTESLILHAASQLTDTKRFVEALLAVIADEAGSSFDVLHFRDGRVCERYSKPQLVGERIVGRVWSFRDVTSRRRAEREAIEAQGRFDSVTRATNDVVYDWTITPDSIWWSSSMQPAFGYEPDAVGGGSAWWLDLIHVEDRPAVESSLHAALESRATTWSGEYRFLRADGRFAHLYDRCYIERDGSGRAIRCIGAIMDISERVQAQERLGRMATILESTTDYVATVDTDGRLLYLNGAARRFAGLGEDADTSLLTLADLQTDWAHDEVIRGGIASALAHGSWSGESVMRARDGAEVPVSVVILAHRGARGETQFVSTVARDMSGVRSLQQQLLQSQKMEAIGQLAGGVAHDFNNLLTVIKAHCEFLGEDIHPAHPQRADVEAIATAGDRASALTRQLLAFSRQQFLKPVALDLNAVVKGVEPMLRRLIGEDIAFRTVCRDDLGVVHADPRQLEQVLVNLAVNARDAMPRGGNLTIATAPACMADDGDAVPVGSLAAGDYCVLTVSDTGTGMPASVRQRIFEPFFTTKEQGKGTGLGLSTAYGIIKQSGGDILVYSEPGHGTTFKVYLPRHQGSAVTPLAAAPAAPVTGQGTVLLVEDEDSLREAARRSLERVGYRVIQASDGREALRHANDQAIDLLVTDMVMPHLGGRELAELLRVDRPDLPVLYMSGYTDDDMIRRGILTSDSVFLEKPFTPTTLVDAARTALESVLEPAAA